MEDIGNEVFRHIIKNTKIEFELVKENLSRELLVPSSGKMSTNLNHEIFYLKG